LSLNDVHLGGVTSKTTPERASGFVQEHLPFHSGPCTQLRKGNPEIRSGNPFLEMVSITANSELGAAGDSRL
jgi:hypothetical protein